MHWDQQWWSLSAGGGCLLQMALEGSLEGIKLGESGDITQIKLEDLTVPVDVLMAGPPCPPWASNGKKCPGEDVRTRVFLAVLL